MLSCGYPPVGVKRRMPREYHKGIQVSVRSPDITREIIDAVSMAAVAAGFTGISEVTALIWRQIAAGELMLPPKDTYARVG